MYLSKAKIVLSNIVSAAMLLLSGFFIFVGAFGILLVLLEVLGFSDSLDDDRIIQYFVTYLAFLGFFIPLAMIAVKKIALTGKAKRFNSLFESDPDGVISLERAAKLFGEPVHELADLFEQLVGKGYLVNCALQNPDNPVFVLNNGAKTATERFNSICCPNCGGVNVIKRDFVERCCYCGASLSEHQSEHS